MQRGRRPTPTKIKELAGNPGKRALNHDEPKPSGKPAAPANMSKEAKAIWTRLVGSMPPGVYAVADEGLLAAYAEAVADYREASAAVKAQGRYVAGSTGQLVTSPAVKDKNDLARLIMSLGARLGLDPAARQALHVEEQTEETSKFDIH